MQFDTVELTSPVAVVSHDAGAANLILAWLRNWSEAELLNQHEFRMVLAGPALRAWMSRPISLNNMEVCTNLQTALKGAKLVLTGTGWSSDLEHQARELAAQHRIPSVAVIDHWVNYEQRFEREGKVVLPNSIWVADAYAADLVRSQFSGVHLVELPNAYLKEMVDSIPPVEGDCHNLLYVLEPMRNDWGLAIAGEFQALDFFAQNIKRIIDPLPVQLVLRPHPSDPPDKYVNWMRMNKHLNPVIDVQPSLNAAIANARWVVGAETYAMVVACEAGRETYSSLPPWGHRCRLPQSGIKHLRDLV